MGRSRKVRYTVDMTLENGCVTPSEWRARAREGFGAPTSANLEKYIKGFEASTAPGGCNEHIGPISVLSAKIQDHFEDKILATYMKSNIG